MNLSEMLDLNRDEHNLFNETKAKSAQIPVFTKLSNCNQRIKFRESSILLINGLFVYIGIRCSVKKCVGNE